MSTDIDIFLAHYGVKGMRWGVRKDRDKSGKKSTGKSGKKTDHDKLVEEYKSIKKPTPSKKQQIENLKASEAKLSAKFGGKEEVSPKTYLGMTKGDLVRVGIGAAVAGGLIYGAYRLHKDFDVLPGSPIKPSVFQAKVNSSKFNIWGKHGHLTPKVYDIPEFTVPKGSTFYRISQQAEKTFNQGTYVTSSLDDFNRYMIGYAQGEKGGKIPFFKVTMKATKDVRIPDMATTLETFGKVLGSSSKEQTVRIFEKYSGGGWDDNVSKKFFDALKAQGYGGILDTMDMGVIGDRPLVLFDTDALSSKKAKPINSGDFVEAASLLKELTDRRPPP